MEQPAVAEDAFHGRFQDVRIEGFGNIGVGAGLHAFHAAFGIGLRGEKDDGDVVPVRVALDVGAERVAGLPGHDDVAQDEVRNRQFQVVFRRESVRGEQNIVVGPEEVVQEQADFRAVLRDEDGLLLSAVAGPGEEFGRLFPVVEGDVVRISRFVHRDGEPENGTLGFVGFVDQRSLMELRQIPGIVQADA